MVKSRKRPVVVRPHDGDTWPCPFCRAGLMRFRESTSDDLQAGWFCHCGYRILLPQRTRKEVLAEQRRLLSERRVTAFRKSMKIRARAERLLKKSEQIAARLRRKK